MSVYIDNARVPYGWMIMCHMLADSTEELMEMAVRIGVNRKWLQDMGSYREHFDVCLAKRKLAIDNGAVEITFRDLAEKLRERREREAKP